MEKINKKIKNFIEKNEIKSYFLINKKLILLLPYVLVAIILIVFPMIMLLTKSLQTIDGINSNELIEQSSIWKIIWRSIYLGIIAAFISLLIAFPFAYIVGRSKSKIFRLISIALLISPLLVFTISKIFSLKILLLVMFDDASKLNNEYVMILGMVYLYMPFMIVPLYSVIQQMPNSFVEASNDLGYNTFLSVIKVVIPYSMKAIFSGLAIVFMLSATSLAISGSLLKDLPGAPINMIGNVLDSKAPYMRINEIDAAKGSTLALVTICVVMGVYAIIYLGPIIMRKLKGGINA